MTHPLADRHQRTIFNRKLAAEGKAAKVCSRCLEIKPLEAFGKYASASDGLKSYCRSCRAANHARRYASDPEYKAQHNANAVRWQKANPARVSELNAARSAAKRIRNADKVQDPNVLKRCLGRCGLLLPETAFRLDRGSRDGLRATCRRCTTDCRRRCRKAHGAPEGQVCYLCGDLILSSDEPWVDHVIPKSKGGGDEPENLRWTHGLCNRRRQASPLTAAQLQRLASAVSAA